MQIVISPRGTCITQPPDNWQELIREIDGIKVLGRTTIRMQVEATKPGLDRAREMLGHVLHFEESTQRAISD
jgi:hypothetical protein